MKAILETNMLIDASIVHDDYEVAVSYLSWAELGYGIRKAVDPFEPARREHVRARLRNVLGPGIPFDDAAADAYETVCGLLLASGREVRGRAIDLMIATTAAAHGAAVITANTDDLEGLKGFIMVVAG